MSKNTTIKLAQNTTKDFFLIASGILLLFACSQISINLNPVPITLQTVGVMLIALLYSARTGVASILSYLVLGGLGLPMFADFTSGLGKLFGATCGYFLGFVACIYVMNLFKKHIGSDNTLKIILNCTIGTMTIFFFGIAWLTKLVGFEKAILGGLIPFIIPGIVKIFILAGLMKAVRIIK